MKKVFVCEGNVSLDKEYLVNLASGKGTVQEKLMDLTSESYAMLVEANNNVFNFDLYDSYLENGMDDESFDYFQANAKCLPIEHMEVKN